MKKLSPSPIKNNNDTDMDIVLKYLRYYFHHCELKSETQKDAILAIMKGDKDVFVSFPSGQGRTMCYLLPSVINWHRVTIVVIPLITRLMEQTYRLNGYEIPIEIISYLTTPQEKKQIYDDLKLNGINIRLLFITPDQVSTSEFKEIFSYLVQTNNLSYMVVDEAHCENKWIYGHKIEYRALGMLKKAYKTIPWIVLTDTAGVDVVEFIKSTLSFNDDPKSFIRFSVPSFRSHLHYDVVQDDKIGASLSHLSNFVDNCLCFGGIGANSEKPAGLIFCKTRVVCEEITNYLIQKGVPIAAYHSGLKTTERNAIKESFMIGHYQVLTVTGIYGMEINKGHIRFVVHWGLPSSISTYYTESGLAGKDGFSARCRIYVTDQSTSYYNPENESILATAMKSASTIEELHKTTKSFLVFLHSRCMKDFCEGIKCRHRFLSEYFGDTRKECDDKCDICLVHHNLYGERSASKTKVVQLGMDAYIKTICSKYQELENNNLLTATTNALHSMKLCDQSVKASNSENPGSTITSLNDFEETGKISKAEPLFSSVEKKDKQDDDSLPTSSEM